MVSVIPFRESPATPKICFTPAKASVSTSNCATVFLAIKILPAIACACNADVETQKVNELCFLPLARFLIAIYAGEISTGLFSSLIAERVLCS
jgi:hypothetical protein